jgi:hypothetical protein
MAQDLKPGIRKEVRQDIENVPQLKDKHGLLPEHNQVGRKGGISMASRIKPVGIFLLLLLAGGLITWIISKPSILSHGYWQGIAGMAQVIAAILTIVVVIQTWAMLNRADDARREAEAARRESANPDWEAINKDKTGFQNIVTLLNTGSGPAKNIEVSLDLETPITEDNRQQVLRILDYKSSSGNQRIVPIDNTLTMNLVSGTPSSGLLKVKSTTRFGDTVITTFRVESFVEYNSMRFRIDKI